MQLTKRLFIFISCCAFAINTAIAGPAIQSWQTANGAKVLFYPAKELPIVDVRIVFDAGSVRDGNEKGLARMTNSLLDEGAADMDANAIAAKFEDVGASFGLETSREMAVLSLRSLSDKELLTPAVDMVATILSKPTFPKDSLDRIRKNSLISLKRQQQNPGSLVQKAFFENLYAGHAYASQPLGTKESLQGMTQAKVKSFFKSYYVGNNTSLAIVGDLDRKAAEALAEKLVGKLSAGQKASAIKVVTMPGKSQKVFIEHTSSQAHVRLGQPGIKRKDEDYFTLYVGNHILGGSGLVSRLSDEIREKRGLSYSVYSYFSPMAQLGPYMFGLQTKGDQAQQAISVMRETLKKFVDEGPTAAELKAAKQNITGGFALRIDSSKKLIGYMAVMAFYDLPLDFLDTYTKKVEAVTVDDIRKAYKKRVHPDKMVNIIVGPTSAQKAAVKATTPAS